MSGYMCSICLRKFTSRIGYSQYRNSCIKTVNYDDDSQMPLNPYSKSHSFTKNFKNIQNNRPSNKNMDNFSQIASKKKNFCNILKDFKVDNDMLFELEDENDMSFEVVANNNEEFFKILQDTLQNFKDIAEEIEPSKSCDELSSSDEDNSKKYKDFLNEAYADLMTLVSKLKLMHNISQGKTYMNNMELDLSYKKTCILKHNDSEYFLYFIPILNCIKNILKVPDLIQNFATVYEELSKISENTKKFFIKNKIMEYVGNLYKILCL
ncbi:zn-finger domain-containing protein [Gigaspora margarita]|uniref:Zn-finger domain-containing protein n=1 Tax=Gigaspora margarita TaxID=4874 RepID=A0A8H4A317_GIGMA|nr:zn-finger domain-containing protein [Gigaspora margarita]